MKKIHTCAHKGNKIEYLNLGFRNKRTNVYTMAFFILVSELGCFLGQLKYQKVIVILNKIFSVVRVSSFKIKRCMIIFEKKKCAKSRHRNMFTPVILALDFILRFISQFAKTSDRLRMYDLRDFLTCSASSEFCSMLMEFDTSSRNAHRVRSCMRHA